MIYKTENRIFEGNFDKIFNDLKNIISDDQNLYLDMSDTLYISSAGIRLLLLCYKKSKDFGHIFGVYNTGKTVTEILEITGLDYLIVDKDDIKTRN